MMDTYLIHNDSTYRGPAILSLILLTLTLLLSDTVGCKMHCRSTMRFATKISDNSSANISIKVSKTKRVNKVRQTLRPKNHDHEKYDVHICVCLSERSR